MIEIKILGTGSSTPSLLRNPSGISIVFPHKQILLDCGENTQIQMLKYGVRKSKLDMILISHLHPDHYLGIFSLLNSMNTNKRTAPLDLFAPADLADVLKLNFKVSQAVLNYTIHFHALPIDEEKIIYEDDYITIENILLKHRITPCNGFLFKEKKEFRNIIPQKLPENTPPQVYIDLKNGKNIIDKNGKIIYDAKDYTYFTKKKSFALLADTCYLPHLSEKVKNVDFLYHEATFEDKLAQKAKETFHSTTTQAATIAKNANVKKLVISHFSSRYGQNLEPLLLEAKSVFPNTYLAIEGETLLI